MAKRNSKVIRYRKPLNFNIGMIVFLVFFVYLFVHVIRFALKDDVTIYEVGEASSVVQDTQYTGLILREETVHTASKAGFVNFYAREGSRASVGDIVYSLDETGQYTRMLGSASTGDSRLSSEQLDTLKSKLTAYTVSYDSRQFDKIYDLKFSVENLLLGYLSSGSPEELSDLGIDTSALTPVAADVSGVVEYYVDGMEGKTEDALKAEDFREDNYDPSVVTPENRVEAETPIYKTITSETWNVYLLLTEEDRNYLADQQQVTLLFQDIDMELTADFSLFTASDGTILGKCTLSQYMIQLADKRYTSVTLKKSELSFLNISGLKIPKSSVISKEFYVVPLEYAALGGNGSDIGFYKEIYSAEGTTAEFITPTIYASTDEYYFLDPQTVEGGTVFRKPAQSASVVAQDMENAATTVSPDSEEAETTEEEQESNEEEETTEEESKEEETEESSEAETTENISQAEMSGELISDLLSADSYTLGTTASLQGVYCVNKGYAVFKQIDILDESDDYYIVRQGQSYGLAVYDHILLNGQSGEEGSLVY